MTTDVPPAKWTVDDVTTSQSNGHVVLSQAALAAQELDDLVSALGVGVSDLALDGVAVQPPTGQSVSVHSTATLCGFPDVDVLVTFQVANGALSVSLRATFTDGVVQILGLPWASIGGLALDLNVTGPSLPVPLVTGDLRGSIELEGLKDPISVTVGPTFGDDWSLEAKHIDLSALEGLLAGHADPKSLMPSSLPLDGLSIVELGCRFDPSSWSVRSLSATLGAPTKTWDFGSGFPEVSGVGVSVALDFDDAAGGEGAGPSVTVIAGATVEFGQLTLPVQVVREPDQWRVGILGASGFPSVGDLVGAATDASMLPAGIARLQLASASLELTLGPDDPTLRSFFVAAGLAEWTLVDGLKLENVALQVFVDRRARDASGFLTGTVRFGDVVEVSVAVEKPGGSAPWKLTLGTDATPSLGGASSLSNVVGGGDVGTHLPSSFPGDLGLTLKDLTVTFDAITHAVTDVTVEVDSEGPWPLPGPSKADVKGLTLALDAAWPGPKATGSGPNVTGSLGGTVDVDSTAITISAKKADPDGPWEIAGGLAPNTSVKFGAFADSFGKFDIPPVLRDATLTSLTITFDTNGDFTFDAGCTLAADGNPGPALKLHAGVKQNQDGSSTFGGSLKIAQRDFTIVVKEGATSQTRFVAAYTHEGTTADSISVKELVAAVSPTAAADIPDIEVDLKDVIFATATGGGSPRFLFALDLAEIDLSALPLVGAKLADAATVKDLQVVGVTPAPVDGDIAEWNTLLPPGATRLPATLSGGVSVTANLQLGDAPVPIGLSAPRPAAPQTAGSTPPSGGTAPAADSTKWFPVQRTFGPVYFDRVGARYDAGALWLLLDASLSIDGLSVALNGLSVGSPLQTFAPSFRLDGIGLDFSCDPVEIAGAFFSVSTSDLGNGSHVSFQYDGAAVVRAEDFTLAALGSYAEVDGKPSLFVFVEFDHALGGPPAAYVTGLMGGFGYNRALRIPAQDEVFQFPFLQGIGPGAKAPGGGTPTGVLTVLEAPPNPWLEDSPGDNWIAVGVVFTSFELAETHALLIAEFGNELQFALLGLTKLRLPQDAGAEAFAYVELELEAVLKPSDGFFGLTAVVSPNSFVFAPDCRLTGGFAFYVWFDGEHAGDFVLTLGGYHPAFTPWPWYPQEPRLALTWPVSDLVTIDGSAYFALTPSCVMGGGGLHVLFHDGNLQAWLTASADFLISWAPFRYSVDIGISVGVSYRVDWAFVQKTFSIELGAQLSLAGPPTHGRAYVSWWVISFSIEFGDRPTTTPVVNGWNDFKKLLPADNDMCKVVIQSGLLPGSPKGESVVRADALQVATECAVPATQLKLADVDNAIATPAKQAPAIRPLGLATIDSQHTLHVKDGKGNEIDVVNDGWTIEARTRNVPVALWGAPLPQDTDPSPSESLVPDQLIGFTVTPPGVRGIDPAKEGLAVDMATALSAVTAASGALPTPTSPAPAPGAPTPGVVEKIGGADTGIAAKTTADARAAIRSVLSAQTLAPGTDDALTGFAAKAQALFPVAPMLSGKAA